MIEDVASSDNSQVAASTSLGIMMEIVASQERVDLGFSQGPVSSIISMKYIRR